MHLGTTPADLPGVRASFVVRLPIGAEARLADCPVGIITLLDYLPLNRYVEV